MVPEITSDQIIALKDRVIESVNKCSDVEKLQHVEVYLKPVNVNGPVSTEAIKETLNLIRHHSTVRYTALPLIITASAILVKADKAQEALFAEDFIPIAGLWLAIIGVVFEIILSRNLICWWGSIDSHITQRDHIDSNGWRMIVSNRNPLILRVIRFVLFSPYLIAIYYWIKYGLKPAADSVWYYSDRVVPILFLVIAFFVWEYTAYKINPKRTILR